MQRFFLSLFLLFTPLLSSWESNVYGGIQHNYFWMKFNNPSKLEGFLTGVTAGITGQTDCVFADLNFEGYWNTAPITGCPCQRSCIEEYFGKLKVGGSWFVSDCVLIKPYVGFGYNYLRNKQDPQAGGGLSYKFQKLFVPVGFLAEWQIDQNWSIGFHGEWRPDVYARVCVIDHKFRLKTDNAFRVQVPIQFAFDPCSCWTVAFVPFYDWNRFGKTTENNSNGVPFAIPRLVRWDLGVRILVGYQF